MPCPFSGIQHLINQTTDDKLVKEIIVECKELPLALKVIGRSLHGQPPKAWITAKDKLFRGKKISEYHKTTLLKCMAILPQPKTLHMPSIPLFDK